MKQSISLNELLIFSCRSGNLDLITERVQKGADINYRNNDGSTPILAAISKGYFAAVKYLINQGADLSCKDSYGNNPLEYAIESNNKEIAELLFDHGAYLGKKASPYAKKWLINFRKEQKLKEKGRIKR